MTKKESVKPRKAKPIDANENYEYEFSPDGERLILRFMSHRERSRLMGGTMLIITRLMNAQVRLRQALLSDLSEDGEVMTTVELNAGFQPLHVEICSLVEKIGIGETAKVVSEWNDFGDYDIVAGLFYRIISVEQALNSGQDAPVMEPYPTPEAIQGLSDKEAEELGEGSPPSTNQSGTSPSDAQAGTSSSGAESTTE